MTVKKKTRGPKAQVRKTQVRMTQVRKFTIEDLKGTVRMNTTATVGNVAGQAADKDKDKVVEKRRALGRGLAALFTGPRVVPAPGTGSPGVSRPDMATAVVPAENTAELRPAGQPVAAVPTPDFVEVESTEPEP